MTDRKERIYVNVEINIWMKKLFDIIKYFELEFSFLDCFIWLSRKINVKNVSLLVHFVNKNILQDQRNYVNIYFNVERKRMNVLNVTNLFDVLILPIIMKITVHLLMKSKHHHHHLDQDFDHHYILQIPINQFQEKIFPMKMQQYILQE